MTAPSEPNLVLIRHGQSTWNRENRFTGWVDVDLTPAGVEEAHNAGRQLAAAGITFDRAWTSVLKRAIHTLWIVLDEIDAAWLPVERRWRLNERHYGALQGLNKSQTAALHGEQQVHIWRRSYDIPRRRWPRMTLSIPASTRATPKPSISTSRPRASRCATRWNASCPVGRTRSPRRSATASGC